MQRHVTRAKITVKGSTREEEEGMEAVRSPNPVRERGVPFAEYMHYKNETNYGYMKEQQSGQHLAPVIALE